MRLPLIKDSSILGSILGSPINGSCYIDKAMGIKLASIASPGQAVDCNLILVRFRVWEHCRQSFDLFCGELLHVIRVD